MKTAELKEIIDAVQTAAVIVEKYFIDGKYYCFHSFHFSKANGSKIEATLVYFTNETNMGGWTMFVLPIKANCNGDNVYDWSIVNSLVSNEQKRHFESLKGAFNAHLDLLLADIQGSYGFKVGFYKALKALPSPVWESLTDSLLFLGNASIANGYSNTENAIKDAATRNSKILTKEKIEEINKDNEEKKKKDSAYTYTKLELGAISTPEKVKTVLNKIDIPQSGLTVKNIELDGAFRISFT